MAHPLNGIRAKIERAKEHIRNLDADITTYINGADHSITTSLHPDPSQPGYVRHVVINGGAFPERISVVAGEVVHQLRSSLDHLIRQLVIAEGTEAPTDNLEFPIFWEPEKYPAAARRKIKGVSSTAAARIESLQPYNSSMGMSADHSLFVLHDLDRIDKHQLLILTAGELRLYGSEKFFPEELDKVITCKPTRTLTAQPGTNYEVSFDIAFDTFGNRKGEPIIPSLQQLTDFVSGVIDSFNSEFKGS